MAYPEMSHVPRIDLTSPQEARHSIAVVMSHLHALDLFLGNICRGHWQWGNNWQGTSWSDGGGDSSGSYHYAGPPGQWQHAESQSGPPGNWQTETQPGEPWNFAYAASSEVDYGNQHMATLLESLGTDPQRAESPPPDAHQVLRSLSGLHERPLRPGRQPDEEGAQDRLRDWWLDEGGPESRLESGNAATSQREESAEESRLESGNAATSQREESAEESRLESGNAETSQREESAEGVKSGSDVSRDRETADGGTPSSNEGERSEASSSGPRNETEGQENGANGANAPGAETRGDPDRRRRGWRIGASEQPTPLVDGTDTVDGGVVEDNRPLGPLPAGLAGYRLKRAVWKSPPTPIPVEDLEQQAIAAPIPIQKMPARRRIEPVEEAPLPAQPKAKPPPHGMAATAPPRKMPPVAKAAAAAAASTAPPAPMRNPTTSAVPPQPKSASYKAPPGPLVYKQPPSAAAMPPAGATKGVRGVKAPPGPRPNGEGSGFQGFLASTSEASGPPGAGLAPPENRNDEEVEERRKSRAEAKEGQGMLQNKSSPVPPAPKALNPADGEIEVVDV